MSSASRRRTKKRATQYDAVYEKTERDFREALDRLKRGMPTHPLLLKKRVRISPATVALEARRSRNALYTGHRHLLAEIDAAGTKSASTKRQAPKPADVISDLRDEVRALARQLRDAASEKMSLLARALTAEAELDRAHREISDLRRRQAPNIALARSAQPSAADPPMEEDPV
jgi:isopenicillin N synthase-like dioxygenase